MLRLILLALALTAGATSASAQIPGNFPSGSVFANSAATTRPGFVTTATAWLDRWCASTQGGVPNRGASSWACGTLTSLITAGTNITITNVNGLPTIAVTNNTITLNAGSNVGLTAPGAMTLGSTYTFGATTDTPRFAALGLGGATIGSNALAVTGTSLFSGANTFSALTQFTDAKFSSGKLYPTSDSTTALQLCKSDGTTCIARLDTTNSRLGINKTAGAFDLDVNGAVNVGGTLTFGTLSPTSLTASTSTITGLTANNSPNASNDYALYWSAADNAIRKITVGALAAGATAGVSSLNGLTGGVSIVQGSGITVSAGGSSVTITNAGVRYDASQGLTAAQQSVGRSNISSALKGQLNGLTISNNAGTPNTKIDIAAGEAASTETNPVLMVLASGYTKLADTAWAVGTNAGCLDTGSFAASTTYHIWEIQRSDSGVTDILCSISATAPTMPGSGAYDRKRRIGAIITDASVNILAFTEIGNRFLLAVPFQTENTTVTTSRTLQALGGVPTGISVVAQIRTYQTNAAGTLGLIQSPYENDAAPSSTVSPGYDMLNGAGLSDNKYKEVMTNTSAQVALRATNSSTTMRLNVVGWIDLL